MTISTKSTITDLDEFLTDLVAFAVANAGFTDELTVPVGSDTLYRISKTTSSIKTYWGLRSMATTGSIYSNSGVSARMMIVLPTAANWTTVADGQRYPTRMGVFNIAPTFTGYSFFTDGVSVFAVLEVTSGVFAHFAFGDLTKVGVWDGGAYLMGNNFQVVSGNWRYLLDSGHNSAPLIFGGRTNLGNSITNGCNYVRYNTGAGDNKDFTKLGGRDHASDGALVGISGSISPNYDSTRYAGNTSVALTDIWKRIQENSPSEATFRAPLLPIILTRQTTGNLANFNILGHVPNITTINVSQLSAKALVNTDWRVFPLASKTLDDTVATPSDMWGVAYKEIP